MCNLLILFLILHVTTSCAQISYSLAQTGVWPSTEGNFPPCPNAPSDVSGNNGDFANYCIFHSELDAQNYCSSQPRCLGYTTKPGTQNKNSNFYQLVAGVLPGPNVQHPYAEYWEKVSYSLSQIGVWPSAEASFPPCQNAIGVDVSGNDGDFANYCIFRSELDAQNYCSSQAKCLGYTTEPGKQDVPEDFYQLVAGIPSTNVDHIYAQYWEKQTVSYSLSQTGIWPSVEASFPPCPNVTGVDVSGNDGNFAKYCIFRSELDAQNYCSSQPTCLGFAITNPEADPESVYIQLVSGTVSGTVSSNDFPNAQYWEKQTGIRQVPTTDFLNEGEGSFVSEISSEASNLATSNEAWYKWKVEGIWPTKQQSFPPCPKAPGVNVKGNGGDFANYCLFDSEFDARNYCFYQPTCTGYTYTGSTTNPVYYQLVTAIPGPNARVPTAQYWARRNGTWNTMTEAQVETAAKWGAAELQHTNQEVCWKDSYSNTKGERHMVCRTDQTNEGGLCYSICPSGYTNNPAALVCRKSCPAGFRDDGLFCAKPKPYQRGIGRPCSWNVAKAKCNPCNGDEELSGVRCYPKCRVNYHGVVTTCSPNCPSGWTDIGVSCTKPAIARTVSKVSVCPDGSEKLPGLAPGNMCYPACRSGFTHTGGRCFRDTCPDAHPKQCGLLCAKSVDRCAVHVVDMVLSPILMVLDMVTFGATSEMSALKALLTQEMKLTANTVDRLSRLVRAGDLLTTAAFLADQEVQNILFGINSGVSTTLRSRLVAAYGPGNADLILYNIAASLTMDIVRQSLLDVGVTIVAAVDPLGIIGTMLAFAQPKCRDPTYPPDIPGLFKPNPLN